MCGEKQRSAESVTIPMGSPPHVRGKELRTAFKPCRLGITPACAGKSVTYRCYISEGKDHPRMCGEKQRSAESVTIPMGSPPHVRGKDRLWQKRFHEVGITPACAGKRRAQDRQDPPRGDHPRMCGEKVSSTSPIKCLKGSPPRMRGKVVKEVTGQTATRITPAYAGKSSSRGVRTCFEKDHPRVCGEKRSQSTSASRRAGSPPRMRGKGILRCEIHY